MPSGWVDESHLCPVELALVSSAHIPHNEDFDGEGMPLHAFHVGRSLVPIHFMCIFVAIFSEELLDQSNLVREALDDKGISRLGVGRSKLPPKNIELFQCP